jgi:hypothetical protein
MNPSALINSINSNLKNYMGNSFHIHPSKHDAFSYVIDGTSLALNRFPNDTREVKVFKWVNDFWLFLEIKFIAHEKLVRKKTKFQTNIFISLSVFQGDDTDNIKNQLFRAEWDDRNSPDEKRAQPHWHITSSQAIENTFEEYANVFDKPEIVQELEKEKQKVLDVKKIHFAMNADWQSSGIYIHKINDVQQIVRWLQGMLIYIRAELES